MRLIENRLIPFKGYKAINLFGVVFMRKGLRMYEADLNHEAIHTKQMKELLYVGFYLWYVLEWIVRLVKLRDWHEAYRNISFEREAYANQYDYDYIAQRGWFAWFKYLKQ